MDTIIPKCSISTTYFFIACGVAISRRLRLGTTTQAKSEDRSESDRLR